MSIVLALALAGCADKPTDAGSPAYTTEQATPSDSAGKDLKTIYVAGGCFWGLEKYIGLVNGVVDAEVGYANGANASATYGDGSGYAEAVKVVYDPTVAPLPFLLDLFYDAIDPTSVNMQGNDLGTEYRTGIYYRPATKPWSSGHWRDCRSSTRSPSRSRVARSPTTLAPRTTTTDYLQKNPGGYCHIPQKLFEAARAAQPE